MLAAAEADLDPQRVRLFERVERAGGMGGEIETQPRQGEIEQAALARPQGGAALASVETVGVGLDVDQRLSARTRLADRPPGRSSPR